MEDLSEEERKALRGSKFAPLPPPPSRSNQSRLAHPGGPLKTNKAVALAKFLERKLQEPNGLASIDPDLVEMAVKNAKSTVSSAGASTSGRVVRHVSSFCDSEEDSSQEGDAGKKKKRKRNKEKKKNKKNKKGAKNVNQGSFGEGGGEGSNLQNKGKKEKKKKKKKQKN
ncbi:unnamed protein product [Linum trigynum]|uniref:Uncharacterized protein n=1 Tax=Linum trigynum TaxID=586398 RepID=A0AAV2FFV9_9ROSI